MFVCVKKTTLKVDMKFKFILCSRIIGSAKPSENVNYQPKNIKLSIDYPVYPFFNLFS